MELFVDDHPVDAAFVGEGTVEDALRHVQTELCGEGRMVIGVRCDGRDVFADAMVETLRQKADSFQRVEVFTGTKWRLVSDAMGQASACLSETEGACRQAAELLTQGRTAEGTQTLAQCLRVWQQIHDALAKSLAMLEVDPDEITINDIPLHEFFEKPRDVLLEVRKALEARDNVMLADVLQYEFPQVTENWHALINHLKARADEHDLDEA